MGNLGSVQNMFRHLGVESMIINNPANLYNANKILLPGVGSFDNAIRKIQESGFKEVLEHKVLVEKIPILGVCLGMQLLTRSSEEGILPGLDFIPAITVRFPKIQGLKVPHMGWNKVKPFTPSCLTNNLPDECRFYFVHSYCVHVDNEKNSILKTSYGITFDAAIQKSNIYGVQFHPEKSHRFGMNLLKNFSEL